MSESLSSSPAARIGVITFPGTLDDVDAARAVRLAGAEPVSLWHKDADLHGVDAVVALILGSSWLIATAALALGGVVAIRLAGEWLGQV